MFKKIEPTLLGDILVSKALITPTQRDIALAEQTRRKGLLDSAAAVTPLGEILIELGFIDQLQLKRGLNWQQRLRHASIAMALCAPFMIFSPSAAANVVRPAPITVEAENYSAMSGVFNETTSDIGGGQNTGNINTGDWMTYDNIQIPVTGTYKITYRVASLASGGTLQMKEGASVLAVVTVPATGAWQKWVDVESTVTLTAGAHSLTLLAQLGGFNVNWFKIENIDSVSPPPTSIAPVVIQAENYTAMSGVYNEPTSDVGGGQDTGNINTGDWMGYDNISIPASGTYKITYRVASLNTGGLLQLKSRIGVTFESVNVPVTGGWQNWVDVEQVVTLSAGTHNLTLLALSGGFNVNWIKIENLSVAPSSSNVSSSTAAHPAITIEAEKYSTMSGVYNEPTADVGGGQDTGNIDTGDWMTYNGLAVPISGTYKITYRVASLNVGGTFQLKSGTGAVLDTVSVPVTGGWQKWVDVERTVTLAAGSNNLTLFATAGGFNVNWFKIENVNVTVSSSSASSVVSSVASSAASSAARSLALGTVIIQAENYATMSGVWNEPTTDVGGGQDTGNINTGDWMNYSNTKIALPFTGKYKITYRVASLNGGGSLALNEAGTNITHHTVSIPKTSGWQNWVDVEAVVDMAEGDHYFTIFAKTGGFNVNWFKIEPIGTPMPLIIQAEDYSAMSGIWNENTADVGGGRNAGNINTGDWMDYKNVEVLIPATASYKVTYRVASLSAGGRFTFHEAGTSTVFDTVSVPVTGGWQKWASVEKIITLPAGRHYFGVKALLGGFNVNWIKVEPVDSLTNPVNLPPSTTSTSSSSSQAAVSSSSSSKPATSSSSWSAASSSGNTQQVAGPVGISWTAPNKRENGDYLDITELGGYEIRYKKSSDAKFTYISINDAWTNSYNFPWLEGEYVFQIAAFDKNGVYSPFVDILRQK